MSDQRARHVGDIRVPMPTVPNALPLDGPHAEPRTADGYLTLQRRSDDTVRDPKTGVVIAAEAWARDRDYALHILLSERYRAVGRLAPPREPE